MGCRSSRSIYSNPSADNRLLNYFERNLGFSAWTIGQIEAVLRRVLNPAIKPKDAFTRFLNTLNLKLTNAMKTLLESKIEESDENLLMIGVLGIMLAEGTGEEKAEAIWYLFDVHLQDCLNSKEFSKLLSIMISASLQFTPDLIATESKESETKFLNYRESIKDKASHLVEKLHKFFIDGQDSITKSHFLIKLNEEPSGSIYTPFHIRCQLEHTQVIPKKYANQFANMKRTSLTAKKLS